MFNFNFDFDFDSVLDLADSITDGLSDVTDSAANLTVTIGDYTFENVFTTVGEVIGGETGRKIGSIFDVLTETETVEITWGGDGIDISMDE